MHLRARLALIALLLMLVPTIALSVISIDSRIATMIDDMSRSTDFMIAQIFEEVRLALSQSAGVLTTAPSAIDGTVIGAANGEGEGKPALSLPSVKELEEQASQWLLFTSLPSLLTAKG